MVIQFLWFTLSYYCRVTLSDWCTSFHKHERQLLVYQKNTRLSGKLLRDFGTLHGLALLWVECLVHFEGLPNLTLPSVQIRHIWAIIFDNFFGGTLMCLFFSGKLWSLFPLNRCHHMLHKHNFGTLCAVWRWSTRSAPRTARAQTLVLVDFSVMTKVIASCPVRTPSAIRAHEVRSETCSPLKPIPEIVCGILQRWSGTLHHWNLDDIYRMSRTLVRPLAVVKFQPTLFREILSTRGLQYPILRCSLAFRGGQIAVWRGLMLPSMFSIPRSRASSTTV